MSKMKRKAIVFDLVDNKRKVPRGDGVKYDTRNHSSSEDDEQSNWVSYLQPEILNLPYMLDLLEQNGVSSSILTGKTRKEVEHLFLKYVTPKPQRTHRANRIGRVLTKLQQRFTRTISLDWSGMVMESKIPSSSSHQSSHTLSNSPSLLIPSPGKVFPAPKSLINTERKTIKLSSSSNKKSSLDTIDAILKTKPSKSIGESTEAESSHKRIINISESSPKKKVKLNDNVEKIEYLDDSKNSSSKKHTSISWP